MPGDRRFEFDKVWRSSHLLAMREAVLTPLYGITWARYLDVTLEPSMAALRIAWRDRVDALQLAGWLPAASAASRQFLRNCPPFGVDTNHMGLKPCRRPQICPFCYARMYVRRAFESLWRAAPMAEHGLVAFRSQLNPKKGAKGSPADLAVELVRHGHRKKELDALGAATGVVMYQFWPAVVGGRRPKQGVRAVRSHSNRVGVAFVPRNRLWHPHELHALRTKTYRRVTKRTLAEAVGWAFAYPKPLMTADPSATVALLAGLKRCRLLATYGLARGRAAETL